MSADDVVDGADVDIEVPRNLRLGHVAICGNVTDEVDLPLFEPSPWMPFTADIASASFVAVAHVLRLRPVIKVSRVAARRKVAVV